MGHPPWQVPDARPRVTRRRSWAEDISGLALPRGGVTQRPFPWRPTRPERVAQATRTLRVFSVGGACGAPPPTSCRRWRRQQPACALFLPPRDVNCPAQYMQGRHGRPYVREARPLLYSPIRGSPSESGRRRRGFRCCRRRRRFWRGSSRSLGPGSGIVRSDGRELGDLDEISGLGAPPLFLPGQRARAVEGP